jgi:hypothetical protein
MKDHRNSGPFLVIRWCMNNWNVIAKLKYITQLKCATQRMLMDAQALTP